MRPRTRRLAGLVAVAGLAFGLAGCGGGPAAPEYSPGLVDCGSRPNVCNGGPTKRGGTLTAVLPSRIGTWSTAENADAVQPLMGVTPSAFLANPDGSMSWNRDLFAKEPRVSTSDPHAVVYELRREALWSDGTSISARDFVFAWKLRNGRDCPDCSISATTGYDLIKSIEGARNDRVVTVTFRTPYPDWKNLFFQLYPAHEAARHGDLGSPGGLRSAHGYFRSNPPTWSGGPYRIARYETDTSVTLVRNSKWYGRTRPALDQIVYRIVDDPARQVAALAAGEVDVVTGRPTPELLAAVARVPTVNHLVRPGPAVERLVVNAANLHLGDPVLRQAVFTAVDRKALVEPGTSPLDSPVLLPGRPGYQDLIGGTGLGTGDAGRARQALADAGYGAGVRLLGRDGQPLPALRLVFPAGDATRQAAAQTVARQLAAIGLDVVPTPSASFDTAIRDGQFELALGEQIALTLMDQWHSWHTRGGRNWGGTADPELDRLLDELVATLDENRQADLLNRVGEIVVREAYELPLHQRPVFFAVDRAYFNVRPNSTPHGCGYNVAEWGLRADALA